MSIHRRAARRDYSEPGIVRALTALGCSVQPLSGRGVCDLMVGLNGKTGLIEAKAPAGPRGGISHRGLTEDQQKWWRWWQGSPVFICRTVEQAIAVAVQELGIKGRLREIP